MGVRIQEVVIDCAEPAVLAAFWSTVLQAPWAPFDDAWAMVDADPVMLAFQQVPEPKSSPKNRLHLDVAVDEAAPAIARAQALGARLTGTGTLRPDGDGFVVLQDPEGNEFCFVVDNGGRWAEGVRAALDARS